jgi:hypothetical protein
VIVCLGSTYDLVHVNTMMLMVTSKLFPCDKFTSVLETTVSPLNRNRFWVVIAVQFSVFPKAKWNVL